MPFLVWDSPRGRSVRELDRALLVIGRDAGSDLVLDDATVSRRHALVQVEDRVKITDLRSTAGTKINGAKLAPDVPCTLEPGDFVEVGKVVLAFHNAPPPAPPSPPAAAGQRPRPRRAPGQRPPLPWKPVAIGLAFVAVVALGALLALTSGGGPPPAEVAKGPEPAPGTVTPAPEPEEPAPRVEEPPPAPRKPAPPPGPERAAEGELPPRDSAPGLPDLIEVDRKRHLPARVRTLGAERIEAIGSDGRLYAIPAKRVTKIEDRADLARRVAVRRRRLAPDDVAGRVALAEWCLERLLPDEARALVREALALRPDDAQARAAEARLEERG